MKTRIIYLRDYIHMRTIRNKLEKTGWQYSRGNYGFYSGCDYWKENKSLSFGSIGSRYVMIYSK